MCVDPNEIAGFAQQGGWTLESDLPGVEAVAVIDAYNAAEPPTDWAGDRALIYAHPSKPDVVMLVIMYHGCQVMKDAVTRDLLLLGSPS